MNMKSTILQVFALLLVASMAMGFGPAFEEDDDAGSLPGDSKKMEGQGPIQSISGQLTGAGLLAGDYQDMYAFYIANPTEFRIDVDPDSGFNTQLFLFGISEKGLLANNDSYVEGQEPSQFSTLLPFSTDGTNVQLKQPGIYYLAISGFSSLPKSDAGHIFFFNPETPFEVSGPDGQGGDLPITGWGENGEVGHYKLWLTGVEFIPPPPDQEGDVTGDGTVDVEDLLLVISDWNCQGDDCQGDANNSGTTDVYDLLIVISNWD